jgi:hypothetical protein
VQRAIGAEEARLARVTGAARLFAGGGPRAYATYEVLRDVLLAPAPPAAHQEIYRQLSNLPGLRLITRDATRATVGVTAGDLEFAITVNPRTGDVLALQRRLRHRSAQMPGAPRIVNRAEILQRGVTARAGARPRG